MRSFYLLLALLPLALATYTKCKCQRHICIGTKAAKCRCENENEIRCANQCGLPKPNNINECPDKHTFCGGIAAIPCPEPGQTCVDNSIDGCDPRHGDADCGGICVFLANPVDPQVVARSPRIPPPPITPRPTGASCGGFPGTPCEGLGEICIDDPSDDCDPKHGGADCIGVCVPGPYSKCGGIAGIPCPSKEYVCLDDPSDNCDPKKGGADCIGICVPQPAPTPTPTPPPKGAPCGGFPGTPCEGADEICVDDPSDDCDPKYGGADCIGICVPGPTSTLYRVRRSPRISPRPKGPRPQGARCGGLLGIPCEGAGEICIDDPSDDCDLDHGGADCFGVCVPEPSSTTFTPPPQPTGRPCGGFLGIQCTGPREVCVDDPSDDCDPKKGGADCPGICVARSLPTGMQCWGMTGKRCPSKEYRCIDDPSDDCVNRHGRIDCPGICVLRPRLPPPTATPSRPCADCI